MTRIKICGITTPEDARMAALLGADSIGLNFYEHSPRSINSKQAVRIIESLPPFVTAVGVFVNFRDPERLEDFALSLRLDAVQLHGAESPDYCSVIKRIKIIKAFQVRDDFKVDRLRGYSASAFLLDAYSPSKFGGTGQVFNWKLVKEANVFGPIILAGGLQSDNVQSAIKRLRPFAVDVSSGVENKPGEKDYDLMAKFVRAVHRADMSVEQKQ